MDDCPELLVKKLCCTCLSQDRKLKQLCRLTEGINNLYLLLSYDSEAYREGFYKDTVNWYICWECWAIMKRISRFRSQACLAQKHLSDIAYGRTDLKLLDICLTKLALTHKTSYDKTIKTDCDLTDNFIDCGPEIKSESDEDIPLSELHKTSLEDNRQYSEDDTGNREKDSNQQPVSKKRKKKSFKSKKKKKSTECIFKLDSSKEYFTVSSMNEEEMRGNRDKSKMAAVYANVPFKCESCIEGFAEEVDLNTHNLNFHTEKHKHSQCDICLAYVKSTSLPSHRDSHYTRYSCAFCDTIAYNETEILDHLKGVHSIDDATEPRAKKEGERKSRRVLNPGSKPRRSAVMLDKRTPLGYQCAECDKYFDNKNQRWKHVQKCHREGYKCAECGKRFAFKNNLARHEQTHKAPPPRTKCPDCDKLVRVDLLRPHARTHGARARCACAACGTTFASRASYEHHLKYAAAHAPALPRKYKCPTCEKGYRSRGELRDHVNYQHMGKTQHKCPVCGKDKKGLREHEFIHTGERPLSCEVCGAAFRQSASLHAHRRRVHGVRPARRVLLLDAEGAAGQSTDNVHQWTKDTAAKAVVVEPK